jgi:hypothetical protein
MNRPLKWEQGVFAGGTDVWVEVYCICHIGDYQGTVCIRYQSVSDRRTIVGSSFSPFHVKTKAHPCCDFLGGLYFFDNIQNFCHDSDHTPFRSSLFCDVTQC